MNDNVNHTPKRKKTLQLGKFQIEHWQIISVLLMVYDFIAICVSYFLALWLRFDGLVRGIPQQYYQPYITFILPCAAVSVITQPSIAAIFFFMTAVPPFQQKDYASVK